METEHDSTERMFDLAIIGAGPAGMSAAIYATRAGLETAIFESLSPGGQMALTEHLENYPGFSGSTSGYELAQVMEKQAEEFGAHFIFAEVLSMKAAANPKEIHTDNGVYFAKSVIIATGARPALLNVTLEEDLKGRGVSYCATCDGAFFRDKTVAVVGGGNTAVGDAIYLSKICSKVYLIHRRDTLRATKIYHERIKELDNVEILWNSEVKELIQSDAGVLCAAVVENNESKERRTIDIAGMFIAVGNLPNTEFLKGAVELSSGGYVLTERDCFTCVPGVFAAGDVRTKNLRQVVTATADGALCAEAALDYVNRVDLDTSR